MKTKSKIIASTNRWTESQMLKSIIKDVPQFGSGIGSKNRKAKVTISVEFVK